MKLELNKEEIEKVLLEWASKSWPGSFNTVEFESSYSLIRSATFSKEEPPAPPVGEPASA